MLFRSCDGYSGYKKLEGVTLCGCLVHAKRKFHEAWKINESNKDAKQGEAYIQKLFAIEHKADTQDLNIEERLDLRTKESKLVLDEFYLWLDQLALKTLPQSLLGKAITYAQNQKEYLCSFLKDGRIQLSNNLAEQSVKMVVIGRKNWLFCYSPAGAQSSAIIYSIIETSKANGINPMTYLQTVLEGVRSGLDVQKLLPWTLSI